MQLPRIQALILVGENMSAVAAHLAGTVIVATGENTHLLLLYEDVCQVARNPSAQEQSSAEVQHLLPRLNQSLEKRYCEHSVKIVLLRCLGFDHRAHCTFMVVGAPHERKRCT